MATRREFFKKGLLAGAGFAFLTSSFGSEKKTAIEPGALNLEPETEFELPPLPYAYDALEPFIDKQTMELHHMKHHQAYINKLNMSLREAKITVVTIEDICRNISKYPAVVRNNGGGHYNHSMFWSVMKPNTGSAALPATGTGPTGVLVDSIRSTFDSFDNFKTKFSEKAMSIFGSGWAWLVINKEGKLEIGSTPNQDNPLMDLPNTLQGNPILGHDIWEQAYYLKYQNRRIDYINAWWNVVNWEEASKRLESK